MSKADKGFEASDEDRTKVELLAGAGIPAARIAAVIGGGISVAVLKKTFATELQTGRDRKLAEALSSLHMAASRGSAAACRALITILKAEPASVGPKGPLPPRRRYQSGKEHATAMAADAHRGTGWEKYINPPRKRSKRKPSKPGKRKA